MNVRQFRDLAIKLLGLFYLMRAVFSVSQFAVFLIEVHKRDSGLAAFVVPGVGLVFFLAWVIGAYLFVFYTDKVQSFLWPEDRNEETNGPSMIFPLATGISLIGLYFFIQTLGHVASVLCFYGRSLKSWNDLWPWLYSWKALWSQVSPHAITLVLSLLCIFKARRIAAFLKRKNATPPQEQEASDSTPQA
jgi:hypothetical protein